MHVDQSEAAVVSREFLRMHAYLSLKGNLLGPAIHSRGLCYKTIINLPSVVNN